MYECSGCKRNFPSQFLLLLHFSSCKHKQTIVAIPPTLCARDVVYVEDVGNKNIIKYLLENQPTVYKVLANALNKCNAIKYNIHLHVTFTGERRKEIIRSKSIALEKSSGISDTINVLIELFIQSTDVYKADNINVDQMVVNVAHNHSKENHDHHHYKDDKDEVQKPSELPHFDNFLTLQWGVLEAKAVLHGHDSDDYSFKWAILTAMDCFMEKKPHLIDFIANDQISYRGVDFDFSGLKFPFKMRQCVIFEQNNPLLSINVFGAATTDGGKSRLIGPLYRTQCEQDIHINLLCHRDPQLREFHYACISKFSNAGVHQNTYVCNTCLRCFWYKSCLITHKADKNSCKDRVITTANENKSDVAYT